MLRTAALLAALIGPVLAYVTQPLLGVEPRPLARHAELAHLEGDVRFLAEECWPRDAGHSANLARAAEAIRSRFAEHAAGARLEPYFVGTSTHYNVIACIGPESVERIVVGAHYDAAEPGVGADDNASGVAGLLELARLLAGEELDCSVELVAFALEEPPHFGTEAMGSFVHADGLRRAGERVRAMLCLEMIGCFRDEPGSQRYPVPLLDWFYPDRGDFIAVVGCVGQAALVRRVKRSMASASALPVRSLNAPRFLPGIDFSDQRSFWDAGFDAVMITDTAFYRNPRYHTAEDTPDTLDYGRLAAVVDGALAAILDLARL